MSSEAKTFEQLKNMTAEQQQNVIKATMAIKALKDIGIIESVGINFTEENAHLYADTINAATSVAMKFDLPTLFDSDEEAEAKIEKAEADRDNLMSNYKRKECDETETEQDDEDAKIDQIIAAISSTNLTAEQKDTEIFKAVTSHAMINMHERMDAFDEAMEEILEALKNIAAKLQPKTGN